METSTILKYIVFVLLAIFLFATASYTWLLTNLSTSINDINTRFIAYIPTEFKFLLGFLAFAMVFIFVRSFSND